MPKKKTRKKTPKKKTTQKDSSFTHEVLNTKYDEEAVVDILQNLRKNIYETTNLGPFLDGDEWQNFLLLQENIMDKENLYYLEYTNKLNNFDLPSNVGMGRSKSERKLGGKTADQCNFVIGKYHEKSGKDERDKGRNGYNQDIDVRPWKTKNFIDDDKDRCWLCSKPLWVNDLVITPQSEHKSPCYLMALTATGLAYTCKRKHMDSTSKTATMDNDRIYPRKDIPEDVYKNDNDALQQLRTWKLLVRGEGMAWSHAYCNNLKSQTPFVSLKRIQMDESIYYMYIIEVQNITTYINILWDKDKLSMEKMPMSVQNLKKTAGDTRTFFKEDEKIIAINNIIKRLIPLVCLLNQGSDIYPKMNEYCSKLLANIRDEDQRTISKLLKGQGKTDLERKKLSIENRIYQNCVRIAAAKGCADNSKIKQISISTSPRNRALLINGLINDLFGNTISTIPEVDETNIYDGDGKENDNVKEKLSSKEEKSLKYLDKYTIIQMDDHACDVGNSKEMDSAKKPGLGRKKQRKSSRRRTHARSPSRRRLRFKKSREERYQMNPYWQKNKKELNQAMSQESQEDPKCMEKCLKRGEKTCEKICGFFGKYKKEGGRKRRTRKNKRKRSKRKKKRKRKKKKTRRRRKKNKRV